METKNLLLKIPVHKPKADKDQKLTIRIPAWKSVELSKELKCDESEVSITSDENKNEKDKSEAVHQPALDTSFWESCPEGMMG